MLKRLNDQTDRSKVSVKLFLRINFHLRIGNELEYFYLCEGTIDVS